MAYGIRKGLEDIASELKGIRNILASMWHSRYENGETDVLNPEAFADEYISTEECGRRLGISDQTKRSQIKAGSRASITSMLVQRQTRRLSSESPGTP
jgi:hypothetical protein